ncbi:hypothetical protein A3F08_03540 [Candidatus Berkelbacteria bacterium RIFCSPHIGHO2_12_FULL_36_9]|uniref:N-acetyltransferase domain-containing protein n=1 Tax=Candidatus Berkelbacteria bacterium RIFCSPHIGHO2_12_FULL_36_9 TaxID=1797469 RepID=A0A1F5EKU1_9BACT|nr:MAG: hypothetical protein A3F08_03540 [Candidatus Berkelbacteria bacterium RIFCSPHIGHO2_12_FULL_36_9]
MKYKKIRFIEREITDSEFKLMKKGFDQHSKKFGNPPLRQKRYSVVVLDNSKFVGCATGLINDNKEWLFLTDLFIEKKYRKRGLGKEVLKRLEKKAAKVGIKHIWTWTAGFEAPKFYIKQGYKIFTEMKDYYKSGHSRIGLMKDI